jgi:hypothetical protein
MLAWNLMESAKTMMMESCLQPPKNTLKLAMQMQRLCLSIFHHILDAIGAIEMPPKTWQRQNYV